MTQVHIVQRLSPGGIEQLVLSMARKADMRLFSLEGSAETLCRDWPVLEAFRDRITGFDKKPGRDALMPIRIAGALRKVQPGSVVSHHVGPLIYGGIAARIARISSLAHVEHDAWHLESARRRMIVRWVLKLVGPKRIAVSSTVARSASLHTGLAFDTIANGIDCSRFLPGDSKQFRQPLGLPTDRRIIGAAGRLETVKGFDLLIRAASHLDPDTLVVIWGDGSQRKNLAAMVRDLDLQDRVILAGPSSAMEQVYPAMDLFCLPSRHEGLPLALLEAQACGVPVVARDVGGVSEGVCPSSGRLVPFAEAEAGEAGSNAQAERLARALSEQLAAPVRDSPRGFVETTHSFSKMLDAYLRLERKPNA